jgi:hypothetical protein
MVFLNVSCIFKRQITDKLYLFFHLQMAKLARAGLNRDPKRRPTMRAVVVSLMTLNSTIDDGSMTVSAALSNVKEHDSN